MRVTPATAFVVRCPHCGHDTDFPASAAVARNESPFDMTCPCGRQLRVRVNVRRALRKGVHLTAAASFPPDRETEVCVVDDVSLTGISLSAYPPSAAAVGGRATVRVVLNDPRRSRLVLKGVVRRLSKVGARLVIGIEFDTLPPGEAQALTFYFM